MSISHSDPIQKHFLLVQKIQEKIWIFVHQWRAQCFICLSQTKWATILNASVTLRRWLNSKILIAKGHLFDSVCRFLVELVKKKKKKLFLLLFQFRYALLAYVSALYAHGFHGTYVRESSEACGGRRSTAELR